MKLYSDAFLNDSYLKYVGWTMHDKVGYSKVSLAVFFFTLFKTTCGPLDFLLHFVFHLFVNQCIISSCIPIGCYQTQVLVAVTLQDSHPKFLTMSEFCPRLFLDKPVCCRATVKSIAIFSHLFSRTAQITQCTPNLSCHQDQLTQICICQPAQVKTPVSVCRAVKGTFSDSNKNTEKPQKFRFETCCYSGIYRQLL